MPNSKFPFVTYPSPEGGWVAETPALKGCLAQGETLEEMLSELAVVEELWLESAKRNHIKHRQSDSEVSRVIERLAA